MLATFWAGPAFGWCNLRLCTNQSVELFVCADVHPADDARHAGVRAMLGQTGNQAASAAIDARWRELVSLSGQAAPAEYDLTYPPELMEQVATAVFTFARDMGMTAWSGGTAHADFHVGALLNGAWEAFFGDPGGFAAFEKRQIEPIRTRLSPPAP